MLGYGNTEQQCPIWRTFQEVLSPAQLIGDSPSLQVNHQIIVAD